MILEETLLDYPHCTIISPVHTYASDKQLSGVIRIVHQLLFLKETKKETT